MANLFTLSKRIDRHLGLAELDDPIRYERDPATRPDPWRKAHRTYPDTVARLDVHCTCHSVTWVTRTDRHGHTIHAIDHATTCPLGVHIQRVTGNMTTDCVGFFSESENREDHPALDAVSHGANR